MAVYAISSDAGPVYLARVKEKYNRTASLQWEFASQALRRIRSWGFNATGEYSTNYVLPIGIHGATAGNPDQMPFIRLIRPSQYSLRADVGVKDLVVATDASVYTGWRGSRLPDIFDPKFSEFVTSAASTDVYKPGNLDQTPWLIGTTIDDADDLFGIKRGDLLHVGWLAAITAPTQLSSKSTGVTAYADTTVYTKRALSDFLVGRHGSLAGLNNAWGASYTTLGSDGGWPGGRGFLDESGRNPWMRTGDFANLTDMRPGVRKDLDDFLAEFADRYFHVITAAVRAATPNHLVFGPAALRFDARPEVWRAAAKYLDVLQAYVLPDPISNLTRVYELTRKPVYVWTTAVANPDSPLYMFKGPRGEQPTQGARGQQYAEIVSQLRALRGSDGVAFIAGIDFWSWVDKVTGGESTNFGLVTNTRDNAYDGKEDVMASSVDAWGYPTGGEERDYGDFLTAVTRANRSVWEALGLLGAIPRGPSGLGLR